MQPSQKNLLTTFFAVSIAAQWLQPFQSNCSVIYTDSLQPLQ